VQLQWGVFLLSFPHQNYCVFIKLHIIGLLLLIAVCTWLSGYDSGLQAGETRWNFWRRFIRVAFTVGWVEILIRMPPFMRVFMLTIIGVVWASCGAELVSCLFRHFLDPALHDHRPLDLNAHERHADEIARLIHSGQREEAFELCEQLKVSGEVPYQHLVDIQACLGMAPRVAGSLAEAARLRAAGRPTEAAAWLNRLLRRQPHHAQAVILLMRIYAEDLRQPARAAEILRQWETQPGLDPAQVESARRQLAKWIPATGQPSAVESAPPVPPPIPVPTVEELVAQGHYGTAIEHLERELAKTPEDFSGWLKLAEIYACHCGNLVAAEKIIRRLNRMTAFGQEQQQLAAQRLKEWHRRG
jgi:tetratricopeptide (TPR) repeat protein